MKESNSKSRRKFIFLTFLGIVLVLIVSGFFAIPKFSQQLKNPLGPTLGLPTYTPTNEIMEEELESSVPTINVTDNLNALQTPETNTENEEFAISTPVVPTSGSARGSSGSNPLNVSPSTAALNPVSPSLYKYFQRSLVSSGVPFTETVEASTSLVH